MKKIAQLWEKYGSPEKKQVQCHVCAHHCIISPGSKGICKTRENIGGTLYTLIYGSAIHRGSIDPVEKKPLYHFYPGSNAFSIATIGCNFHCQHCQNWEISQSFPNEDGSIAEFTKRDKVSLAAHSFHLTNLTPENVVKQCKKNGVTSIAYTYNEPTIWYEFIRDTAILAHKEGIKNILVTNGYSSREANDEFVKFIDAANIDFKAFNDKFYKKIVGVPSIKPVLETAEFFKKNGMHVEITNLLIPNENDSLDEIKEMVKWIIEHLGADTPLHFSAYRPMYHLNEPSTPSTLLNNAWNIAKTLGLYYVFMGNVLSEIGSNTYCPACGNIIISRRGYAVTNRGLSKGNKCNNCGEKLAIVGEFRKESRSFWF